MKYNIILFLLLICADFYAQTVVTTSPQFPSETDQITITFDVTNTNPAGKTPLKNYTGDVYAYTGVAISTNGGTPVRWQKIVASWSTNSSQLKMTKVSNNVYRIVVNNPRQFYPSIYSNEKITELCFVLRSSDGTKQTEDIFVPLFSAGFSVVLTSPSITGNFGDPMRSPAFVQPGSNLTISAATTDGGTGVKSITLYVNNSQITQTTSTTLSYSFVSNNYPIGKNDIKIVAVDNANRRDSVQFVIMKNPAVKISTPPAGTKIGLNYGADPTKVTLAFYAPKKSYVYVIGEFGNSDWKVDTTYFLNKYEPKADSVIWWKTISNLENGKEYSYQFLVDGNLRIFDPYTEKILDKNNDPYIPAEIYPNLKAYPGDKTTGLVSVLQTNQPAYQWLVPNFSRPAKEKLIIYELLVRDYMESHWYKNIVDYIGYLKKLGVNAVELMPVMEFEANDSWGYNPTTYMAPDKYYGTKNDLKALIDACHQNGMAVILDIVLNHAYGSNPMVQLYWDAANNRPASNNPWFNTTSPNTSYSWGFDFNHESKDTKYFVDRVTSFWLTEYKVDGFRFDFSKGFTNTAGDGSAYDAPRIAILKRIANSIWNTSPGAYVILEHFAQNNEEIDLSNYGLMLWGNLNGNYSQAAMGFIDGTANFSNVSYKNKGWQVPNLVGYMESHDEERLMYKNLTWGNSSGNYNVKEMSTALKRIELAANLFILVPGPKMIWQFGELGYDYSIEYGGRLTKKPVKWEYFSDADRKKLYYTFAYLNELKKNYPAFSSTEYTLDAYLSVKSLYINHTSMKVAVFGNFDVTPQEYQTSFQTTGKWYEFYSGDSLDVTNVNMNIQLQPGEYRLYTTQRIKKTDIITPVEDEKQIPRNYYLSQNYPNPFNPATVINYQIPSEGHVSLKVYDILGKEVALLVDEYKSAGTYKVQFQAGNLKLASGIYFYRLQAGTFISTRKMILIK